MGTLAIRTPQISSPLRLVLRIAFIRDLAVIEADSKPVCLPDRQTLQLIFSWDDLNRYLLEMDEARFSCHQCPAFIAESQELLEQHKFTHHEHDNKPSSSSQQPIKLEVVTNEEQQIKCPLCSHQLADNKTAESAVEKLTCGVESPSSEITLKKESSIDRLSPSSAVFRHRCTDCSMAFKTNERLQQHQLSHSNPQTFRLNQQCPFSGTSTRSACKQTFENASALYQHVFECHRPDSGESTDQTSSNTKECELCGESFENLECLLFHLKSPAHLNKTKQLLEDKPQISSHLLSFGETAAASNSVQDFKRPAAEAEHFNDQMFSLLLRQNPTLLPPAPQFSNSPRSSSKKNGSQKSSSSVSSSGQTFFAQKPSFASNAKPFRCNVCLQAYSQGQTLDTHLRSLSHQNRMNRLQELVANGQVDPLRPVSEQPGGIPQKIIAELLGLPFSPEKMDVSPMLSSFFFGSSMANELDETNSGVDLSLKKRKANPSLPNFMKPLSTDQQNKHSANGNNSFFNNFSTLNKSKCTQPNPMLANQMMAITQLLQQQQSDSANTPTNWLANMMASSLLNSQLGLVPTNQEDQDDNEESPSTSPLSSSPVLQTPRIKVTPAKSRQHNKKGGDDSEEKANSAPPLDKPFCLSDLLSRRESKVEKQEQVDREESPPKVKRLRPDSTPLANLNPLMAFGESPKTPVKGTPKKLDSPVNDVGNQLAMMMSASSAFPSFLAAAMAAGGGMGPGDLSGGSIGMSSSDGDSPQKRARTRITDDQLKVLRQYFDINNSPSEEHIKEMSLKAGLPEKVIKHWFRNTLFKERQRDKDSPYNFNQTESANFEHPTSNASSPSAEASAHATSPTNPPQSNTTLKCSPASSPHPENGAETPNEEDEEEDEEEDNQTSSPTNETSSSTNTTFAADFLVNLNKAAAVAAMGNYAAVAASMAQQHQLPAGFASFFGATSNSPAIQEPDHQPEEKTLSAMLGLGHFATFSPSSLAPSSNNATSSLVQQPQSSLIHSSSQNSPALPRVIVVWFQNARQKARKIYENQPNHPDNNDRFVRTPGANFQCKRCQLVFQRYYELIQHQQKVCYMGDGDAQLTDNKSLEENLSEDEKVINSGMSKPTF
uniref:Uncharacterized protein n=1 Tax=Ditylenchus dipsaci TaxID=166011 RepID=A0A915E129_9BILA